MAPLNCLCRNHISRCLKTVCNISVRASPFSSGASTDFGFRNVDVGDKVKMVREVFSKVATKYDVMNDVMSVGAHRLWKDELVGMIGYPSSARADPSRLPRHLDVAGGTGDVAFRSLDAMVSSYGLEVSKLMASNSLSSTPIAEVDKQIVVCDINPDMLAVGRQRAPSVVGDNKSKLLGFVEGNAESLPFQDASFDLYTIAFGLRNVTNKEAALKEAYRVLRKGGRLMVLEFSHLENTTMQTLYDTYSFNVIPEMGRLIANDKESYQYLVESIRRFPKQDELLKMIEGAGFAHSSYRNMTFGIVAIHSGFKM